MQQQCDGRKAIVIRCVSLMCTAVRCIFIKQLHMQPGKLLVAFVFCNVYR